MGFPGKGIAALQLKWLRIFFESLPFNEMVPSDNLTTRGYCLSKAAELYVIYLPEGGKTEIDLSASKKRKLIATWYEPVSGNRGNTLTLRRGKNSVIAPTESD